MRNAYVVAFGLVAVGCGGSDEAQKPPATPEATMATTPAPTPAPTETATAAPAKAPAPTMGELERQTGKAMDEALNGHDPKKLASLYTEDAVVHTWPMEQHGRDDVQRSHEKLFAAFPDAKFWPTRITVNKDVVISEFGWSGTNTGEFMGHPATGKAVGGLGASVMWFSDDGLIKQEDTYIDGATVMMQLSGKGKPRAVPTPPSSAPEVHVAKGTAAETANMDAVKAMYAALDAKKEADFLATASDDVTYDDYSAPDTLKGKAGLKGFFAMFTKAFPDMKNTAATQIAADDLVLTEVVTAGTHKGQLGPFKPTNKPVTLHALDIVQIKDGKVVRGWTYSNNMEFLTQTGLAPKGPPAAGGAGGAPADKANKPAKADKADKAAAKPTK